MEVEDGDPPAVILTAPAIGAKRPGYPVAYQFDFSPRLAYFVPFAGPGFFGGAVLVLAGSAGAGHPRR